VEITVINLVNLRNEEHVQFQTGFYNLVGTYGAATLGIEPLFAAYTPLYKTELGALDAVRKSSLTGDIFDADSARDTTFSGLKESVSSACKHFNATVADAAERVLVVFDTYGKVSQKAYDAETAAITDLVSKLQGSYAADIQNLNLTGWVAELQTQNAAFDTLKNNRYSESAAVTQQNMKNARTDVDKFYRAMVKRINALIEVNGESTYEAFVKGLNERVDSFNNLLAQRKGRSAVPLTTETTGQKIAQ